jgi:hypothetical protein
MAEYECYMWSVTDWRSDELYTDLDNREQGIYRNLIDECWFSGSITSDPEKLARQSHEPLEYFALLWPKIRPKFYSVDGGSRLKSKRVEIERKKFHNWIEKKSKAGHAGAKARWDKVRAKSLFDGGDNSNDDSEIYGSANADAMPKNAQTQTQTQDIHSSSLKNSSQLDTNVSLDTFAEPSSASAGNGKPEEPPKPRPRDLAMDHFSERCLHHTGIPYQIRKGDGKNLADLRKLTGTLNLEAPPDWIEAVENYFASPHTKVSLSELAEPGRYAIYRNSPVDRYRVPINHQGANGNGRRNGSNESAAEARARRSRESSARIAQSFTKTGGRIPD